MKRAVYRASADDTVMTLLAVFEWESGEMRSDFYNAGYERDLLWEGIFTSDTGRLTPADGEIFVKTLKRAYSNTSRYVVTDSETDGIPEEA